VRQEHENCELSQRNPRYPLHISMRVQPRDFVLAVIEELKGSKKISVPLGYRDTESHHNTVRHIKHMTDMAKESQSKLKCVAFTYYDDNAIVIDVKTLCAMQKFCNGEDVPDLNPSVPYPSFPQPWKRAQEQPGGEAVCHFMKTTGLLDHLNKLHAPSIVRRA
jgi:hypothetical protein